MKRQIITFTSAIALVAAVVFAPVLTSTPALADPASTVRDGVIGAGGTGKEDLTVSIKGIIDVILYVLGAVAVIMIIIGGFRYVVSNGDSGAITSAKNTIFYAVIGLVVAILAYAIVNFVLKNI